MTRLHILGSGMPTPTPDRFGTAFVVETGSDNVMFDCGPAATHKLVKMGLSPTDIDYLFFTHHHFDHNADYPCFLLCRWDQGAGKERTLRVFGPGQTSLLTERLIGPEGAFFPDWNSRVKHPLSKAVYEGRGGHLPRTPPRVEVEELAPGAVREGVTWRVLTGLSEHAQPYLDCLAYRIDTDGGSIAFLGDSRPCQSVINLGRGVDYLLYECWDDIQPVEDRSKPHAGASAAGQLAADMAAGSLILTHSGPAICKPRVRERVIGDVRSVFDGDVIFAEELLSLDL